MATDTDELKKRIQKLEEEVQEKNRMIEELNSLLNAFETATEFSRKESIDLRETLHAQERVKELAAEELKNLMGTVKAYEQVNDLARNELKALTDTARDYGKLLEYASGVFSDIWARMRHTGKPENQKQTPEIDELYMTMQAYENLSQLSIFDMKESNEKLREKVALLQTINNKLAEAENIVASESTINRNDLINLFKDVRKLIANGNEPAPGQASD